MEDFQHIEENDEVEEINNLLNQCRPYHTHKNILMMMLTFLSIVTRIYSAFVNFATSLTQKYYVIHFLRSHSY
jgi:hypothetical protein